MEEGEGVSKKCLPRLDACAQSAEYCFQFTNENLSCFLKIFVQFLLTNEMLLCCLVMFEIGTLTAILRR